MQTKSTTALELSDAALAQVTGGCIVIFPPEGPVTTPPKRPDPPVTIQPFPRVPNLPLKPILLPWKRPTFSIDV